MREAYLAYDGTPDVSQVQMDQNKEVTDLFDAIRSAKVDCGRTRSEVADAARLIAADPASPDAVVKGDRKLAVNAIKKHCGPA